MGRKIWDFIRRWWRLWLSAFLIAVTVGIVFNIMRGDPNLSYAIVALGTFLLAIVTAWSIEHSNRREKLRIEEDRRIREEDKDLDARTRALDEILHWAEEAYATLVTTTTGVDSLQSEQRLMIVKLASTAARVSLVREYCEWLGGEQLAGQVDATFKAFNSFVDVLNEDVNKRVGLGEEWPTQAFDNSLGELRNCLERVIFFACLERVGLHSEMTIPHRK